MKANDSIYLIRKRQIEEEERGRETNKNVQKQKSKTTGLEQKGKKEG